MAFFYFESANYCGIRQYRDLKSAEAGILREVGTYQGVSRIIPATTEHAEWVRSMGGHVPENFKPHKGEKKKK